MTSLKLVFVDNQQTTITDLYTFGCNFQTFALSPSDPADGSLSIDSADGTITALLDYSVYPASSQHTVSFEMFDSTVPSHIFTCTHTTLQTKVYSCETLADTVITVPYMTGFSGVYCPLGNTAACIAAWDIVSSTYTSLCTAISSCSSQNNAAVTEASNGCQYTLDTSSAFPLDTQTIYLTIGTENITKTVQFWVWDCNDYLTWSTAILTTTVVLQGTTTTMSSYLTTTDATYCPTTGGVYQLNPATSGVTIDAANGDISIYSTSTLSSTSMVVEYYVSVIPATYSSHQFTVQIVDDCLSTITFPWTESTNTAQVSETKILTTSVTTSQSSACTIGTYSLSATVPGITIDSSTGYITISSDTAISETSLQLQVLIGSANEVYTSTAFTITVFDCLSKITFTKLLSAYTGKKGSVFPTISATATTSDTTNCPITEDTKYSLETDASFISMASDGTFTVDTSSVGNSSSSVVSVTVGTQTKSSSSFSSSVEIDDCSPFISFDQIHDRLVNGGTYYVFMVLSSLTDLKINAVARSNNTDCAIGSTYYISNQPDGSKFDASTGILTTPVASINTSPYYLNITAVIGENNVTAKCQIKVTQAVNFRPLFLETLVDWVIIKGSNDTQYFYFSPLMTDIEEDAISYEIVNTGGLKNLQDRLISSNNTLVFTLNAEDVKQGDYQISIILSDSERGKAKNLKVYVEESQEKEIAEGTQEEEQEKADEGPSGQQRTADAVYTGNQYETETRDSQKTDQTAADETEEEVIPPPAPYVTKYDFKPNGELSIKFNLEMSTIDPTQDLNEALEILLDAPDYDAQVKATWVNPKDNSARVRRSLQRQLQEDDEDFQLADVGWHINSQDPKDLKIKLVFDDLDQAHYYKKVEVNIKDPSAFPSADGTALDATRKQETIKPIYMYIDEGETAQIEVMAQTAKGAAVTSGVLTLIVSKLIGAGMQCIWSMMAVLQEISFNSLMNVSYKPRVMYVQETMAMFAKVDVMSLENWWADNWYFVETYAHNYKFDIQGMDSKNFLVNTGSMLVNFLGMLSFSILFGALHKSLKNRALKSRRVRKILVYNLAPPVLTGTIMFLYQFSTDAVICSLLQFKAYHEQGFEVFLENPGDIMNMVGSISITVSVIFLTLGSIAVIHMAEDLDDFDFQLKYFMFIDGLDLKTKSQAQYNNIVILRYIMNASIFIWIDNGCIQSQILLISSVQFLTLKMKLMPFESALSNQLGIFNDTMVYLTLLVQFLLADSSQSKYIQDMFGNTYLVLVILALIVNFCVAMFQMYTDFKEERRLKNIRKEFEERWKELHQELQNDKARKQHRFFQVLESQKVLLEMKDLNAGLMSNGWRPITIIKPKVEAETLPRDSFQPEQKQVEQTRQVKIINNALMDQIAEKQARQDRNLEDASQEQSSTVPVKFAKNSQGRPIMLSLANRKKQKTTLAGIQLAQKSRQNVALTVVQEEQFQNTEQQAPPESIGSISLEKPDSLPASPSSSSSHSLPGPSAPEEEEKKVPQQRKKVNNIGLEALSGHSQRSQSRQGAPENNSTKQSLEVDRTVPEKILKPEPLIQETIKKKRIPQRQTRSHKDFDQSDEINRIKKLQSQNSGDETVFDQFDKLALDKLLRQQTTYKIKLEYKYRKLFPQHRKQFDPEMQERSLQLFKRFYDEKLEDAYQEQLSKGFSFSDMVMPPIRFTDDEIDFINQLCLAGE